jgi:CheY-like chemotaxis protein/two-component sensor histidine kinase
VQLLALGGGPDGGVRVQAMMKRQIDHLVRLVDDLLEVSRITRGKIELRRQKVDVVAIARSALEAAEPALRARGHAFGADLPDKPLWIDADGARLTQVFVNLLHNAAKYTDAGGRVQLAVREAEGHAVIDVRDNGIGIAPEEQQSVFEMFVQLDKSLGRGAAGLGVGLTIAKQLVELHQGTLTLHSVGLGQGSTFTVALPIVTPPLQSDDGAARAPRAEPAGTGLDVLVADDNTDFAISFANVLRMEGHQVRVVHDGVSALKACIDATPDVAFLDIGMPELDGYELGARMRERDDLRSVVLVAVTGWGQAEDRHKVRLAGYDHHWVKPVDMQRALKLLDTLRAERSAMKTPERG